MAEERSWKWGAPRLITRAQLRAYLQVEEVELQDRFARGQVPGPLWSCNPDLPTARWDRHAVDRAVDRASSIPCQVDADTEELDKAFGLRSTPTPRPSS